MLDVAGVLLLDIVLMILLYLFNWSLPGLEHLIRVCRSSRCTTPAEMWRGV